MIIILIQYAWIAYKEDTEIWSLWPSVPHLSSWEIFQRSSEPLALHRQFKTWVAYYCINTSTRDMSLNNLMVL